MLISAAYERIAADLRWVFRDSEGELGLKSNFGGMIASLEGGGWTPKPTHEVDERRLQAAERRRRILEVLDAIPVWARVVLSITYRYADGENLLVGILTVTAQEHRRSRTVRSLADWLERIRLSKDPGRRRTYSQLRLAAADLLCCAFDSYTDAAHELAHRRRLLQEARC
jgi:hypothetical protein